MSLKMLEALLFAALGVLVLCDQLIFNVFFTNPF